MIHRNIKRILFISTTYPPINDGGALFLSNLTSCLAKLGTKSYILSDDSCYQSSRQNGVRDDITVLPGFNRWDFKEGMRKSKKIYDHSVRIAQPDHIHILFPSSRIYHSFSMPIWPILTSIPLCTTYFGLSLRKAKSHLDRVISVLLALRSKSITTHDPEYYQLLRALYPHKRKSIHLIPVGSNFPNIVFPNHDSRASLRQTYPFTEDLLVSFFGNLDETRGLDYLLRAVYELKEENWSIRLLMIGQCGEVFTKDSNQPIARKISQLILRYGLTDHISWFPFMEEIKLCELLAASDILCLPFTRNTLGRTSLMLGLQLGLPIITTTPELSGTPIRHKENLYLVPKHNHDAIIQGIKQISTDQSLKTRLSKGAKKLSGFFNWETISKRYLSLYK